jgi:hypothetical protein
MIWASASALPRLWAEVALRQDETRSLGGPADHRQLSVTEFRRVALRTGASPPFPGIDSARQWVSRFADWYNGEHRHSAIRYVTPDERHSGLEHDILARRHQLYQRARRSWPQRWTRNTHNWTPVGSIVLNPHGVTA